MTASALTLAIDELERHLGVQLVVRRRGRGVTLTPAGSRLLVHARDVLRRVEDLSEEASRSTAALAGRFALGCFTTLTPFFAPSILAEFQRAHPDVDLEVTAATATDLSEHLLQGRLDTALMYSVDVPSTLTFEPVLAYRPHVLVAAEHRLADRVAVSLGDLIGERLIMLDVPPTAQNTGAIFEQLSLRPQIGHVSTSFEAVRCMVGAGLGYAVMFQQPATAYTYDGHEVRTLEIVDRLSPAVVGLARPRGAVLTARDRALHAFLSRDRMGGAPVGT